MAPTTATTGRNLTSNCRHRHRYIQGEPRNLDILCGTGIRRLTNNQPGNQRFERIINDFRDSYRRVKEGKPNSKKKRKTQLIDTVVTTIKNGGSRFVQYDRKGKSWFLVEEKAIHEKVSFALRDSVPVTPSSSARRPFACSGDDDPRTEEFTTITTGGASIVPLRRHARAGQKGKGKSSGTSCIPNPEPATTAPNLAKNRTPVKRPPENIADIGGDEERCEELSRSLGYLARKRVRCCDVDRNGGPYESGTNSKTTMPSRPTMTTTTTKNHNEAMIRFSVESLPRGDGSCGRPETKDHRNVDITPTSMSHQKSQRAPYDSRPCYHHPSSTTSDDQNAGNDAPGRVEKTPPRADQDQNPKPEALGAVMNNPREWGTFFHETSRRPSGLISCQPQPSNAMDSTFQGGRASDTREHQVVGEGAWGVPLGGNGGQVSSSLQTMLRDAAIEFLMLDRELHALEERKKNNSQNFVHSEQPRLWNDGPNPLLNGNVPFHPSLHEAYGNDRERAAKKMQSNMNEHSNNTLVEGKSTLYGERANAVLGPVSTAEKKPLIQPSNPRSLPQESAKKNLFRAEIRPDPPTASCANTVEALLGNKEGMPSRFETTGSHRTSCSLFPPLPLMNTMPLQYQIHQNPATPAMEQQHPVVVVIVPKSQTSALPNLASGIESSSPRY